MLEGSCLFADLDDLPDCDEAKSSPTASRPDSFKAVDVIESMNVLTHWCKLQDIPVSHNLSPDLKMSFAYTIFSPIIRLVAMHRQFYFSAAVVRISITIPGHKPIHYTHADMLLSRERYNSTIAWHTRQSYYFASYYFSSYYGWKYCHWCRCRYDSICWLSGTADRSICFLFENRCMVHIFSL